MGIGAGRDDCPDRHDDDAHDGPRLDDCDDDDCMIAFDVAAAVDAAVVDERQSYRHNQYQCDCHSRRACPEQLPS